IHRDLHQGPYKRGFGIRISEFGFAEPAPMLVPKSEIRNPKLHSIPPRSRELPVLWRRNRNDRNEGRPGEACATGDNSDIPQKIAPSDDHVPGGDHAALLNVVVLDLAFFYELRFSSRCFNSSKLSI